jgi:cell fate (sporulation/competence/biofilm development) regulator YlbF (YheA/YmcA/DUF963 family)
MIAHVSFYYEVPWKKPADVVRSGFEYNSLMSTTEEILSVARDLAKLIESSEPARKMAAVLEQLKADVDAQRLFTDHTRAVEAIAEKQAEGKPIEVKDKHRVEDLQKKVIRNDILRNLQTTQMDYVDLMRKVDEAMSPEFTKDAGGAPQDGAHSLSDT